jgi:peptidoglycan hydrolase-like protein with peptidoglycan-binding domain
MGAWPTEQIGSSGEDVRTVQYLLAVHGHPVLVDGSFGPTTRSAVQAFQSAARLVSDGVVGDATWSALIVVVTPGASGTQAQAVQGQLRKNGWDSVVDGSVGPDTTRAVRDLQSARHLTVDGSVGPATWFSMVAGFQRVATAVAATQHLWDAWGTSDRPTALLNATQAAADFVLRGKRPPMTFQGCSADPFLGPETQICAYTVEGAALALRVQTDDSDGWFVGSASWTVD